MKLKILIVAALLLIMAKTMIVDTRSAYTQETSYSISIVPDRRHNDQKSGRVSERMIQPAENSTGNTIKLP
jgi:hypothetical protein